MGGCSAGGSTACKDARLTLPSQPCTAAKQEALLLCRLFMPADFLFSEDGAGSRNEKGDEGVEHGGSEHSNFNTGQWALLKQQCCFFRGCEWSISTTATTGECRVRMCNRAGLRVCTARQRNSTQGSRPDCMDCHPEQPLHEHPAVQACTSCEVAPAVQHSSMRGPRHMRNAAPG